MKIEGMLKKTTGIIKSEVLYNTSRVKVTFDENVISSEIIKEKITSLGYVVKSEK
jgi:copper chaperone CopZ